MSTGDVIETLNSQQNNEPVEGSNRDQLDSMAVVPVKDNETQPSNKDSPEAKEEQKDKNDEVDLSCGIGRLRTKIFGKYFANLYSFCILFGLANLFANMVSQVVQVQLISLQRQFNIDNNKAGLFETSGRIGYISTLLFAGHFAKKYHIPMIVGVAGVIQGLILMVPAVMQFVDPYYLPTLTSADDADASSNDDSYQYTCNSTGANDTIQSNIGEVKHVQYIVVLFVQTVKGITDTFHNGFLPVLYMDDNMLDKTQMSIMLGIWQILNELSSPIGKQINGVLSEVPIDLRETDMTTGDRRFVAAWWLAFLVFGAGTALFSFPIMLFPRSLVSERQKREAMRRAVVTFAGGEVADEVLDTNEEESEEDQAPSESPPTPVIEVDAKDISESKRKYSLSRSRKSSRKSTGSMESKISRSRRRRSSLFPPVIGPTERRVSINGDLIFEQPIKRTDSFKEETFKDLMKDFPKAILRIMKNPIIYLSLIDIAIISIIYSGTGIFRNSFMVNEYNVTMSEVAYVTGIANAVGVIVGTFLSSWVSNRVHTKLGYSIISFVGCFLGLVIAPVPFFLSCDNQVVYGASGEYGRDANITTDCNCTLSSQLLSCGNDGNNYISPCYAGCFSVDGKDFKNCSLPGMLLNETVLTPGLCSSDCHTNFLIYCVVQGFAYFFYTLSMIPRRLLILRIVDPQDRGFSTSLFNFCFVLFGIPSANIFGTVIDGTCLVWDDNLCTLYDRDKIRYLMAGIDAGIQVCVQITFTLMVIIFYWEEVKVKREEEKRKKTTTDVNANVPTIQ